MVAIASTVLGSSTSSLLREGVSGIAAGQQKAQRAASDIVSVGVQQSEDVNTVAASSDSPAATINFAESAVELIEAKNRVKASAAVIRAADELVGTLIDTLA